MTSVNNAVWVVASVPPRWSACVKKKLQCSIVLKWHLAVVYRFPCNIFFGQTVCQLVHHFRNVNQPFLTFFRWKAMELAWQHQMSVLTTWLWTSNGHRPLRAPGRLGTMAVNPQRQTPLQKDPSDPVAPNANPPSRLPSHWAFYTSVGCGLCFGMVQLSRSTSVRSLVCRGQWSFIATQLCLVYTAARPRTALCTVVGRGASQE